MLEFLILVILVSIAFGISLQNALWGALAFVAGLLVLLLLGKVLGFGVSILADWLSINNMPQAKKARQIKRKQAWRKALEGFIVFLLLLAPFVIALLLAPLSNGNTGLAILLILLPFAIEAILFIIYARNLIDKKARQK